MPVSLAAGILVVVADGSFGLSLVIAAAVLIALFTAEVFVERQLQRKWLLEIEEKSRLERNIHHDYRELKG